MSPQAIKTMIRLWSRQGLLTGDLNLVQQYCLAWALSDETEERVNGFKLNLLAINPEMYRTLYEESGLDQEDDAPWITPRDEDEANAILDQVTQWAMTGDEL